MGFAISKHCHCQQHHTAKSRLAHISEPCLSSLFVFKSLQQGPDRVTQSNINKKQTTIVIYRNFNNDLVI